MLPLARSVVDAAAHRRPEPGLVAELWDDPTTLVLVLHEGRLPVSADGTRLDLRAPSELATLAPVVRPGARSPDGSGPTPEPAASRDGSGRTPDPAAGVRGPVRVFLGTDAERAYLAVLLADLPPSGPDLEGVVARGPAWQDVRWATLRDVGHALSDRDADLATTAVALAEWHLRHLRCTRCGAPTTPVQAGWVRRCPEDGTEDYPRTDAAVIMAVTDDDGRILLGHAPHWPPRRFSTLAGFVEPGESVETAVRREVAEETGVVVGDVSYMGSQPWPFPASLMLAFRARARTVELTVDTRELAEARWFTRAELHDAVREGRVLLPMRTSVALALIEEWYGGPVDAPPAG